MNANMEKILSLPIKTVVQFLQNGELNAIDLTNACLQQLKRFKHLNALITPTETTAAAQAKQSAERYKNNKPISKLLDGIPVVVKDNFCTASIKTTCASKMLSNFTPTYSATVYKRLQNAGTVLLGKTNMDQFAMGSGTINSEFGPAKNVWGYKEGTEDFFIAGGSSGGSAVAVAANMCFAALGSDTGGSVRNPASYCGLVGLKPTYGLLSRLGLIPLSESMDAPGIITKTVDDCLVVLNAIAGYDKGDSTSLWQPSCKISLAPDDKLNVKGLKIGIPIEYHNEYLSEEVLNTWNEVASFLESNGAIIKQVSLPHTEHSIVCYTVINQCEIASNMARYDGIKFGYRAAEGEAIKEQFSNTRAQGFSDVVRNRIVTGNYFLLARNREKYFVQAQKVRRLIMNDFDDAWEKVDLLLTPTTLSSAPLYSEFVSKSNRDQCAVQDYCTQPVNMAGIPAISIPIKLSNSGMPLSLQLIGKNLNEPLLLAVSKYIENAVEFPKYTFT